MHIDIHRTKSIKFNDIIHLEKCDRPTYRRIITIESCASYSDDTTVSEEITLFASTPEDLKVKL